MDTYTLQRKQWIKETQQKVFDRQREEMAPLQKQADRKMLAAGLAIVAMLFIATLK